VAFTGIPAAYSELVAAPAGRLVRLPDTLGFEEGAAAMLQGMTAHYLATSTYPLKEGDIALVHAGAGGVGLLLIQIAKMRKATVIATVSTEEKASLARDAGADEVILYTRQDFSEETMRITGKSGVHVVYDSVGKDTFERSLKCLRPRGYLVLYGQSSGKVQSFDPQILNSGGSLFLTRPTLNDYIANRKSLDRRADEVLGWIGEKRLRLRIEHRFPLSGASTAHSMLEGRRTTGKVILLPGS
jgi:NADPH2:quinone reductase